MLFARRGRGLTGAARPFLARACATSSNPQLPAIEDFSLSSPTELYSFISQRVEGGKEPPSAAYLALTQGAAKSGVKTDAALALSAHTVHLSCCLRYT